MRHIGNRYQDLHRTAREWLRYRQLVEVTRIVVVDRAPQQRALVADLRSMLHGGR